MTASLYRSLYRIRRLEEEVARVYPTDRIKSPVHLSIGQEAVSVALCEALKSHDVVFGTYRGHALYLARGGDMGRMVAELYGKATGCTGGKGGSMHLIAPECGVMGTSAVVGTTIANAVGYAYAEKVRRRGTVVASFFGDGATEEGVFSESLNFASLKKLPVLFVCENNQYAIHTHQSHRQATTDICGRVQGYGIRAISCDSNEVRDLITQAKAAVDRIRSGQGPEFMEVLTYRWREHVGPGSDFHLGFRKEEEASPWYENDPVRRIGEELDGVVRLRIQEEVEEEVASAFAFAEESPFPEPQDLLRDVTKEDFHVARA